MRVGVRVHVCVCRESGPKKAGSSSLPNFPSVMRGWQAGVRGEGKRWWRGGVSNRTSESGLPRKCAVASPSSNPGAERGSAAHGAVFIIAQNGWGCYVINHRKLLPPVATHMASQGPRARPAHKSVCSDLYVRFASRRALFGGIEYVFCAEG